MNLKRKPDKNRAEWLRRIANDTEEVRALSEKVGLLSLFPGSVQEYERFTGYSVVIVDTQRQDKGVTIGELKDCSVYEPLWRLETGNASEQEKQIQIKGILARRAFAERMLLGRNSIEALVNVQYVMAGAVRTDAESGAVYGGVSSEAYGLPVKRAPI